MFELLSLSVLVVTSAGRSLMCYFVRRCPRCWRTSWTACWRGIRWSGPVPPTSWSIPSSCRPALRSAWCPWWSSTASACPAAEATSTSFRSNQDSIKPFLLPEDVSLVLKRRWLVRLTEMPLGFMFCSKRVMVNLRPQGPGTSPIPLFHEFLCSYIEYFIMLSSHFSFLQMQKQ